MAKTLKITKISKARRAIFSRHLWVTPVQSQKYHEQLVTGLDQLRKIYTYSTDYLKLCPELKQLNFNGEAEHDGNLILEEALANTSPENARERLQKMADRANARSRRWNSFYETFGVQLRRYWIDNMLGFDSIKFDVEVVKSGDNESVHDAILRQWGEAGWKIIEDLMR